MVALSGSKSVNLAAPAAGGLASGEGPRINPTMTRRSCRAPRGGDRMADESRPRSETSAFDDVTLEQLPRKSEMPPRVMTD